MCCPMGNAHSICNVIDNARTRKTILKCPSFIFRVNTTSTVYVNNATWNTLLILSWFSLGENLYDLCVKHRIPIFYSKLTSKIITFCKTCEVLENVIHFNHYWNYWISIILIYLFFDVPYFFFDCEFDLSSFYNITFELDVKIINCFWIKNIVGPNKWLILENYVNMFWSVSNIFFISKRKNALCIYMVHIVIIVKYAKYSKNHQIL